MTDALRPYARHHDYCHQMEGIIIMQDGSILPPCTCGLDAALAAEPAPALDVDTVAAALFSDFDRQGESIRNEIYRPAARRFIEKYARLAAEREG